ncbi:MAG: RNA methyltransferase [Leptospiraceae bacterium]|nr:tRNA (guanine-N2)-dimethyltransferase [Leptospiraceae bacterium]MCP5500042.1 RNA methyltransferase [Leptospiraceae bacterium]
MSESNKPGIFRFLTDERKNRIREVLEKRSSDLTLVMENINDPHNFSAVLRSCDAVGILQVYLVYHSGQKYPAPGLGSSASAKKWIDIRKFSSIQECYEVLRSEGKKIYTTHMSKESQSLYDLDLTGPIALVFGNEHTGVSESAYTLSDGNFIIPQVGMVKSLNISVACAVSLFEAYRQRKNAGLYDKPQLSEERIQKYMQDWSNR